VRNGFNGAQFQASFLGMDGIGRERPKPSREPEFSLKHYQRQPSPDKPGAQQLKQAIDPLSE
jgi:hypothetical protein